MNKEIIICLTIIILVVTFDIITKKYTQTSVEDISNILSEFKLELIEDNISTSNIKEKMNKTMEKWRNNYNTLSFFIEHDELEKVEMELTSLSSSIDIEEYDDGIENIDRCIFILNHIKEKYILKFKNVF